MRIIAGTARGRKLVSPGSKGGKNEIRPTADRAREALFNILGNAVRDARVLDLFSGTGALGLEALSRGAFSSLFIDNSPTAIGLIRKNIDLTGFSGKAEVLQRDLARNCGVDNSNVPDGGFSLVFLDPPYRTRLAENLLDILGEGVFLKSGCIVVAESDSGDSLPDKTGMLECYDKRQYGETGFWFYLFSYKEIK
ncbi:MAG: 16S rRNA (guanine(966)-N(2))-methyltransferase RsmD [Desulfobulbaceae bacterium]|uniref:16S rRNA (Guanine(966)-N(2))-methyltransferase RsmD n=1 Tax=Candidatus Desulfobia pelagia TaxID=2841692 RepID=A0A8J6NCT8_9BACT|nr:16S rRNA (guanine(966)-N(2))-methyltransferase RsmD [Candidatus Desulfobia pelagia]